MYPTGHQIIVGVIRAYLVNVEINFRENFFNVQTQNTVKIVGTKERRSRDQNNVTR